MNIFQNLLLKTNVEQASLLASVSRHLISKFPSTYFVQQTKLLADNPELSVPIHPCRYHPQDLNCLAIKKHGCPIKSPHKIQLHNIRTF